MVEPGYCECGCGQTTRLATHTVTSRGWVRGEPVRFVRGHQARQTQAEHERRFWSRVEKGEPGECWPWRGLLTNAGYGRIKIDGVTRVAHRVAWEFAGGDPPGDLFVCHACDNRACCNPEHLFLGTQADNIADRDRKGRAVYHVGEKNAAAKLTAADVLAIRERLRTGESQYSIARALGTTQTNVGLIGRRKTWKHL